MSKEVLGQLKSAECAVVSSLLVYFPKTSVWFFATAARTLHTKWRPTALHLHTFDELSVECLSKQSTSPSFAPEGFVGNSVNEQFFWNYFCSSRFCHQMVQKRYMRHTSLPSTFVLCGFFVRCLLQTQTLPLSCEMWLERFYRRAIGNKSETATASLHLGWNSAFLFFFLFFLFFVAAQQQKNSADTCPCETPCNLTRYGKELSMVKIPSKGSARYLSRKYDKSEDYIRYDGLRAELLHEWWCSTALKKECWGP